VALSATVASSGAATPTGAVTFSDTSGTLCSDVPLADGTASCSATFAKAGAYTVTATYSGDASDNGSSASETETVAQLTTATAITNANPTTEPQGTNFEVDVTVTSSSGPAPTGTVEVANIDLDGVPAGTYTCPATLSAGSGGTSTGECAIDTGGNYGFIEVEATYAGDAAHAGSASTGEHKLINLEPTTTAVVEAGGAAGSGDVTLTATVTPVGGGSLLAGASDTPDVVNFTGNPTVVADCTDVAIVYTAATGNTATCTVGLTSGDSYDVTANFPGDEYAAGSSGATGTFTAP
jgi:large repetitive protein